MGDGTYHNRWEMGPQKSGRWEMSSKKREMGDELKKVGDGEIQSGRWEIKYLVLSPSMQETNLLPGLL